MERKSWKFMYGGIMESLNHGKVMEIHVRENHGKVMEIHVRGIMESWNVIPTSWNVMATSWIYATWKLASWKSWGI